MNIFVLDRNPVIAARYYCDSHSVKICLEMAQMLSTAMLLTGGTGPYKITHKNHPCTIWVRSTRSNYLWACKHFEALLDEYTKRYNKIHSCAKYLDLFLSHANNVPDGPLTLQPECMPDYCKTGDVVQSYRKYYINEKSYFAKWRMGNVPEWWTVNV